MKYREKQSREGAIKMKKILALALMALLLLGHVLAEENVLTLPDGLEAIGAEAFMGVSEVDKVELPDGVTAIDDRAFKNMSALKRISIPESVQTIGADILTGAMDAVLVACEPGSAAMRYAIANQLDYDAGTICRAVLIGNTYADTWNALLGPDTDVEGLKKTLEMYGWSGGITAMLNADYDDMVHGIESAFSDARAQDISLFYYSGHGLDGGELVAADETFISPYLLREMLDAVPGRKVILVDACYSGGMLSDGDAQGSGLYAPGVKHDPQAFQQAFIEAFRYSAASRSAFGEDASGQYFILTAARWDQESDTIQWDRDEDGKFEYGYGLFSSLLCDGLGYDYANDDAHEPLADADGDGAVSIQEAADYIQTGSAQKYTEWGWNLSALQQVQAYPQNCRWFAPFRR